MGGIEGMVNSSSIFYSFLQVVIQKCMYDFLINLEFL